MQHLEKINALPAIAAKELGVPAAIVIGVLPDGGIIMNGHGLNHARTVEHLANAIHATLCQHDQLVRQGAAGVERQAIAEAYDRARADGMAATAAADPNAKWA
jgi:hypothetical protein